MRSPAGASAVEELVVVPRRQLRHLGRHGPGAAAGFPGRPRLRQQSGLRLGHGRHLSFPSLDHAGPRQHADADGGDHVRLAIVIGTVVAIMRVSPSPVLRAFASALCLVLPRRAGADPADLLVQPVAAGSRVLADAALRRHDLFGADQRLHDAVLLGGRRAVALRGGLHGGDHPGRHQVRAERPGRGGQRARHALSA